jgi:ketosteroid isomerase-like protein/uncharacterized damage-inducible protein DinB
MTIPNTTNATGATTSLPEVWLRGPVDGVPAMLQPAAHALLQAQEELHRTAHDLPPDALWARPGGVASVGFHLRHAAGVIDRLLTYAREAPLSDAQRAALAAEAEPGDPPADAASLLAALDRAVAHAIETYRATEPATLRDAREVGRSRLPSTVMGLLFHVAEHLQRHAGQAGTTARVVLALRPSASRGSPTALEAVRELHDTLATRDLEQLRRALAPDAEIVIPPALPWGGMYRGPAGFERLLVVRSRHVEASFDFERLVPSGDRVIAIGRTRGTARATAVPFDVPTVYVWTMRGDVAVGCEVHLDVPAFLSALEARASRR